MDEPDFRLEITAIRRHLKVNTKQRNPTLCRHSCDMEGKKAEEKTEVLHQTGRTYTVVAAPAGGAVGHVPHLLQSFGPQVAQLPQAAVVEHPGADPAGIQVVGRPHLAHVAHLVAGRLRRETSHGG